ncbi:hypothetical protein DFJ74DRAFT_90412 [Hyaloraphidium curvatum]|nr:hypothetical protein DFJ74DRAFT_90412 [Hyaloraphidium curvatum]
MNECRQRMSVTSEGEICRGFQVGQGSPNERQRRGSESVRVHIRGQHVAPRSTKVTLRSGAVDPVPLRRASEVAAPPPPLPDGNQHRVSAHHPDDGDPGAPHALRLRVHLLGGVGRRLRRLHAVPEAPPVHAPRMPAPGRKVCPLPAPSSDAHHPHPALDLLPAVGGALDAEVPSPDHLPVHDGQAAPLAPSAPLRRPPQLHLPARHLRRPRHLPRPPPRPGRPAREERRHQHQQERRRERPQPRRRPAPPLPFPRALAVPGVRRRPVPVAFVGGRRGGRRLVPRRGAVRALLRARGWHRGGVEGAHRAAEGARI